MRGQGFDFFGFQWAWRQLGPTRFPSSHDTDNGPALTAETVGSGSSTTTPPTSEGAGSVSVAGSGASTSSTPTSVGSGSVSVAGSGASTTSVSSSTGSGTVSVDGSGTSVTDAPTSVGLGAVVDPVVVYGIDYRFYVEDNRGRYKSLSSRSFLVEDDRGSYRR